MYRAILVSASLALGGAAHGQPAPPVTNVQTATVAPDPDRPAPTTDLGAITPADSGSSIDKPASQSPMPQTGYHPPVINKTEHAEPAAHARVRALARDERAAGQEKGCTPDAEGDCAGTRPR